MEDISTQVHDMKENLQERGYIARVCAYNRSSTKMEAKKTVDKDERQCRFCGYSEVHLGAEDCPAFGK